MINKSGNLFQGELVLLTAEDPEIAGKASARWARDSEYQRLLDTEAAQVYSAKMFQQWFEKDIEKTRTGGIGFNIRTLEDDRLIGFVGVFDIQWNHGDAWIGIGIGERDQWGKGYGTDAMRVILRYAFTELNLQRVSLGVFSYNKRAMCSYEKAGFRYEGAGRESLHRDGQRANDLYMGILRSEWEKLT
ncbi:GNAT family N-acetyltransferase [Chloroflexota bacterium]